jgi:hypothetical protein
MLKDLKAVSTVTQLIDPVTLTADANGASIDLKSHQNALVCVAVGESGDTLSGSVKIELELEESTDDSTFTDCADADVIGYVAGTNDGCFGVIDAAAEDDAVYTCQYIGSKRYIRPVINVTGLTNGTPIGAIGIAFDKKYV